MLMLYLLLEAIKPQYPTRVMSVTLILSHQQHTSIHGHWRCRCAVYLGAANSSRGRAGDGRRVGTPAMAWILGCQARQQPTRGQQDVPHRPRGRRWCLRGPIKLVLIVAAVDEDDSNTSRLAAVDRLSEATAAVALIGGGTDIGCQSQLRCLPPVLAKKVPLKCACSHRRGSVVVLDLAALAPP